MRHFLLKADGIEYELIDGEWKPTGFRFKEKEGVMMPTSNQTEHDTHFDTPDDPEERCDTCGQPWRKCRCAAADRYNDERDE